MMYTKNGKPLQVEGSIVYSKSGKVVGQIIDGKVFGTGGRYVGSIDGNRLVYRSTDSACVESPFIVANIAGIAIANASGAAIIGQEPDIPD